MNLSKGKILAKYNEWFYTAIIAAIVGISSYWFYFKDSFPRMEHEMLRTELLKNNNYFTKDLDSDGDYELFYFNTESEPENLSYIQVYGDAITKSRILLQTNFTKQLFKRSELGFNDLDSNGLLDISVFFFEDSTLYLSVFEYQPDSSELFVKVDNRIITSANIESAPITLFFQAPHNAIFLRYNI